MQITVDIPDEIAADMLAGSGDPASTLLELAGYTACNVGRISERQCMNMLHLESRFDVHAFMKKIDREQEAIDAEMMRMDAAKQSTTETFVKALKAG